MSVTIITDSAASLPVELARERGVVVVPLRLRLADVELRDGEWEVAEVLRRAGTDVTTSGPPPGEFTEAIEAAGEDGALVLTIASAMSSTHDAARLGASLASRPVEVVDTGTAGGAEGLVVLSAAERAAQGASLEDVVAAAREAVRRVRLVAAVEGLESLVRSGRVPQIAGWAGRMLGLRPLFEFRSGSVRRLAPATGKEQAINSMLRRWRRDRQPDAALHLAVLHALDPEGAAEILSRIESEMAPKTAFVGEFSPVMAVHTGPLLGLAWWFEP